MTAVDWFAKALKCYVIRRRVSRCDTEALTTAIHLGPEYAEAYGYRGFAYYRLGNHGAAMENYDKAVPLWPNFAEVYYFRATLYGQLKDYEKAIIDYTKAIELKPTLVEAYYLRALNCGASGRYQGAIRDMKTAAELGYEPAKRFLENHRAGAERN